jgi:Regulator of chromosome condensation (RCC1) repeat
VGNYHNCALKTDGTLACWGYNSDGQAPQPSMDPATLADGIVGTAYNQVLAMTATNYTPPSPVLSLTGGLPNGLGFVGATLSGTPTAAGSFPLSATAVDANGFAATQAYTLLVTSDSTAPVITPVITGTLGSNGWYTSDVTLTWSVVDDESSVTSQVNCVTTTVSTDTTGTTFTCEAASEGGSATKSVTIKRDATAPTAALAVSAGTLGLDGWYVSDVTLQTNGTDAASGIASCTVPQTLSTDSAGTVFNGSCTDQAGNTANAASLTVKRDATAPTAALAVSAGTLGLDGWYVSDVTLQTSGTDAASGIASCTAPQTLSTDSADTVFNGSCTDQAGNVANAAAFSVKLDKTKPTLAPTVLPNPVYLNGLVTATANAADALSGLDSQGCSAPNTGTLGSQSVVCTATDKAGNTNSATISYKVIPDFPRTGALDTFNRANGSLGANWGGQSSSAFYKIAGNKLDVQGGGPIVWKPTAFGVNQEAFVTLSKIDTQSSSQGLLLKVQAGTIPDSGAISVAYDAKVRAVRVSALRPGRNGVWKLYSNQAATFANGDILGARIGANGIVKIYKNGTLIATVTLNSADQTFFNGKGGRIGVMTVNGGNALLDNFGGGNLTP